VKCRKWRRDPGFPLLLFLLIFSTALQAQSLPIPLKLAEPAVTAAQKAFPDNKESRLPFIQGYCQSFLDSWRDGIHAANVTRGFSDKPTEAGYSAGKAALAAEAAAKAREVGVSPADFGYTMKVIEGTFVPGFETSHFLTADTGEKFHTCFGMVNTLPEGKVKVNVWISPEALMGYGHMGQWKREIILIGIQTEK